MSIPKIDPYPPAPTPEDDEATFDDKAYAHAASLELRRVQMNEVASYVNTRASDANNRATASASSATASANSATRADEWANKAPGSVVALGKYSARHYADLSDKFANTPEDVEVAPGKYSAQHYMEKAKKIADVHATTVETDPLPTVLATNVQEALRDLVYQADQLRVAKNQLKYGDGPYPVLDFQFAGAKYLDPRIQFTRASADWDESGREYGINEPVLVNEGMWLSGARTNLATESETLGVFNQLFNAEREIVFEPSIQKECLNFKQGVESNRAVQIRWPGMYATLEPSKKYTISFLIKEKGALFARVIGVGVGSINLDLDQMKITAASGLLDHGYENTGGGWLRCWFTFETPAAMSVNNPYLDFRLTDDNFSVLTAGDGGSGILLTNFQVEEGFARTPHIPTKGSQVTVSGSNIGRVSVEHRAVSVGFSGAAKSALSTGPVERSTPFESRGPAGERAGIFIQNSALYINHATVAGNRDRNTGGVILPINLNIRFESQNGSIKFVRDGETIYSANDALNPLFDEIFIGRGVSVGTFQGYLKFIQAI